MAIEDLIGNIYSTNMQLPLQYGGMYTQMYNPMYDYGQSQGNNMTQLGGQSMGLYGNLANTQASMYTAELPFQMEQQKWNSLTPVLGGLLGQFGMGGGAIAPIQMNMQRPNVMSGYHGAVNNAYNNARSYDSWMNTNFDRQNAVMPKFPGASSPMGGMPGPQSGAPAAAPALPAAPPPKAFPPSAASESQQRVKNAQIFARNAYSTPIYGR